MLIGPAAAHPGDQSSGAGGYADLLNLQTLTVPSLAFAATVVRSFRGCYPNAILHILCRYAMPSPASRHAAGYSKVTRRGSTTWYSINGSSLLSNLGRGRSSERYFYGGIGAWYYLPHRNPSSAFALTTTQQYGPLACSWECSCRVAQRCPRARFGSRNDGTTGGWRGCWSPLMHCRYGLSCSVCHYRLYSITRYECY